MALSNKLVCILFFVLLKLFAKGGCAFYSFKGSNLPASVKSFSVICYGDDVSSGPPDLETMVIDKLTKELESINLYKIGEGGEGDIRLKVIISKFEYNSVNPKENTKKNGIDEGTKTELTIEALVDYEINADKDQSLVEERQGQGRKKKAKKMGYTNKRFVVKEYVSASHGTESAEVKEKIDKIIGDLGDDIINTSVLGW